MEKGTVSEQAGCGAEQWEEERFHPEDATARGERKSTESISTRFLVGTADSLSVYEIVVGGENPTVIRAFGTRSRNCGGSSGSADCRGAVR